MTVGGTGLAGAGLVAGPQLVKAATEPPKGKIPDTPYKTGHMTFFTSPAAVLGEPSHKGHILAAEEINAQGGLLGKRKIETITADEAAGTDANVKELRRMKLEGKIDLFTGIISSGNTPGARPGRRGTELADDVRRRLHRLPVRQGRSAIRNTRSASPTSSRRTASRRRSAPRRPGRNVRKIAHIHPDYSYGRNAAEHFTLAIERLLPGTQVVSESWPKLGTTDFTSHITKILSSEPDLLFTSVWGGDYVAFYKQALRYGLFDKMKVATTLAFGVAPHAIGKDHPEGVLAGVHSNYHFTYPGGDRWPLNKSFVQRYFKRWNEYPNFQSEGAYVTLYMLKAAIERANKLVGGWPDDEAIISQLEGLGMRYSVGLSLHPARQSPGLQGRGHRVQQEQCRSIRSRPGIPTGSSPFRSATSRRRPNWPKPGQGHNEFDRGGRLDQEDLAEGGGLSHSACDTRHNDSRARLRGRGWFSG